MTILDQNIITGWPKDLRGYFQGFSASLREDRAKYFKFGISVDYDRRWKESYCDDFDEMRVLYQTTSHKNVVEAERTIIEYYKEWEGCVNVRGGGGGPNADQYDLHYLYVVIKYK